MKKDNVLKPTLWRTCRGLANVLRLRILRQLFKTPFQSVSSLAASLDAPVPVMSSYLRLLNARGLLAAERRGAWVYYSAEADPSIPWSGQLLNAVRSELHYSNDGVESVFQKLTAFTHPRRIDICRLLATEAPLSLRELQLKSGFSKPAVIRHIHKLVDRGVITCVDGKCELVYRKDQLLSALFSIAVCDEDE